MLRESNIQGMIQQSTQILKDSQDNSGGILASPEKDRYPCVYPRDCVFICKALIITGCFEQVRRCYEFLKRAQLKNGEWVQRYDTAGRPKVSRPKETDCVGLVIHGIYDYFCNTGEKEFLESMWKSVQKGVSYIETMIKGNGLVYGQHAVFENYELEEGYEIWNNCWCWRGIADAARIAEALSYGDVTTKWRKKADILKDNILNNFWDSENGIFIKTIKESNIRINSVDISTPTPLWAGLISYTDPRAKKTIDHVRMNLWDPELGGFWRFRNWEFVKDWHWYDGGHGPWVFWTLRMAWTLWLMNERGKANESLRWCLKVMREGHLPEHVSKVEEFLKWEKNEQDKNPRILAGMEKARESTRKWKWKGRENNINYWVSTLSWSHAELVIALENMENFKEDNKEDGG